MLNRYSILLVLASFTHVLLPMDSPLENKALFGVHTDLNSFLSLLQRSPQRVAAVTAFLTRAEDLSKAAKKGASVRVVSQPYALKKLPNSDNVHTRAGNIHDKLYFVRAKDGHGHGFMGSANCTNHQWNNCETVLSWQSPDRTLPGFTEHLKRLVSASGVNVRSRQNTVAAMLDSHFEDKGMDQEASSFHLFSSLQSAQQQTKELDSYFVETPPCTPKVDWLSGGRLSSTPPTTPKTVVSAGKRVASQCSGGKRSRSDEPSASKDTVRPLKKRISSQLRPDAKAFTRPVGSSSATSPFRSPLNLLEGSPSTRIDRMDSTKRCELISSFDFKNGDLIPWLGFRIKEKQKCDYFLSTMSLNHPDFIKKIQEAAKAGSRFKILVDKKAFEKVKNRNTHPLSQLLGKPNIEVRSISGGGRFGSQHSKVFTRKPLSGQKGGLSIVSTANFTKESSSQSNYLVSLPEGSSKKESFEALEKQFLEKWGRASIIE